MLSYDLHTEQQLLQKIAEGSEPAFREIFERYRSPIYAFAYGFTHSKADAEEIVQDTFLTIWQRREHLDMVDHPRNYVYTIVRHKTYDFLNKVARNEKLIRLLWENMQLESNVTEELLEMSESKAFIDKALSMLSDQKQLVFRMSRLEGKNHEEIASLTGLSKSRVKNIIVEVLKHIRTALNQQTLMLVALLIARRG